jgi:hypothetical protein
MIAYFASSRIASAPTKLTLRSLSIKKTTPTKKLQK